MRKKKLKFKVGDWIICNKAPEPKAYEILSINYKEQIYVLEFENNVESSWISFADEDKWEQTNHLYSIEKRIKKEIGL